MGTHPNTILMAVLTPDDLSRKTMQGILEANGVTDDSGTDVKIYGTDYHTLIMEDNYEEGYQIAAKEGDLVFFDFITYGYGETVEWSKVEAQKISLETWAKIMCELFNCSYKIELTANYW